MNKKIVILLIIVGFAFLLCSNPAFAKQKVKIKISGDDSYNINGGFISIKLVNKHGKEISTNGKIYYKVTDSNGNYKWVKENYDGKINLRYYSGNYKVYVKFYGDSHYKKTTKTKSVSLAGSESFNPYTYYDTHNWGVNQKIDDYIEDNYWDEEIYDDASNYDGEGY